MAYRNKRGPLSIQRRIEDATAAQMHLFNTANGGTAERAVFMLYTKPEEEKPASVQDVFALLKAKAKPKPKTTEKGGKGK